MVESYVAEMSLALALSNTTAVPALGSAEPVKVTIPTVPSVLITTVAPLGIVPLATKLPTPDSTPVSCDPSP